MSGYQPVLLGVQGGACAAWRRLGHGQPVPQWVKPLVGSMAAVGDYPVSAAKTKEATIAVALNLDTARAFRSPVELRSLVDAVATAITEDEADWIEWKSAGLRLTDKKSRVILARHIIGMANRRVREAQRYAEGHGYILVGVEPGARSGVSPIVDLADLESGISPYLGPDGPRWTATYDTAGNAAVLVIIVDPPQLGDSIHVLHREYDSYRAGDIFVRKLARTDRAGPGDVRYLQERAADRAQRLTLTITALPEVTPLVIPHLDLKKAAEAWLSTRSEPLARVTAQQGEWERLLKRHRGITRLYDRSRRGQPLTAAEVDLLTAARRDGLAFQMHKDLCLIVERYLRANSEGMAGYSNRLVGHLQARILEAYLLGEAGRLSFRLMNTTDAVYTDIEVIVESVGNIRIVDTEGILRQMRTPIAGVDNKDDERPYRPVINILCPSRVVYQPPVQALRPHADTILPSVHLIVAEPPGTEVLLRWTGTALNVPGQVSGERAIRVGQPVDIDAWLCDPTGSLT